MRRAVRLGFIKHQKSGGGQLGEPVEGRRVSRALQGSIENVSVGGGALLSDLA